MAIAPKIFLNELVRQNILTQENANTYELEALKKNVPIDTYLLQETGIKKDLILKIKASLLNVGYVNIANAAIDPQALNFIPDQLARRFNILPYLYDSKNEALYVATADPLNISTLEFFEAKTSKKVIFTLAEESDIVHAIQMAYSQSLTPEVKDALQDINTTQKKQTVVENAPAVADAPIAKIVNTVLEFAVKSNASDIHIEPQETKIRVRYRVDGQLQEKITLPRGIHESLVSRIKILSELKIDEKRIPQDGRFSYKVDDQEVDLRVSTLPTVNGEKIVMRLLRKTGGVPTLDSLGLRGSQLKDLEEAIARPYGIVLVTGPTGSGKTTTLYSVLTKLNKPSTNIVTLEDPVEYQIAGINQVQINPQAGLTFATGLRSFLRQDPNIILVGEIRDSETTQLAIQAALTGHLVFATLHTNDAATAIPRLLDLGGEPFLIASVLAASVAQRIIRRICVHCKETFEPPEEVKERLKAELGDYLPKQFQDGQPIQLARGRGCEECGNSGYQGRIALFEVLKITPSLNTMILKHTSALEIKAQAIAEGFMVMKQDGLLKALEGITTLEEIMTATES